MTPQLRFPEFADAWQLSTIGELGRIVTGKTPATSDKKLWNGELLFVTPSDINNGKYQYATERTIHETHGIKVLPAGSIYYTCIASIGKMALSTQPSVTNQQINSIVPKSKYNNEFIYYAILNLSPKIKATQANTTLPIVNKTDFSRFRISIPQIREQEKVADFLSTVDERIAASERKCELLEHYKRGTMQQLFNQRIRFKKPDGSNYPDWQEKKLSEVFTERVGKGGKLENMLSVTIKNGVVPFSTIDRKDNSNVNKSNYKQVRAGDIAYNSMRMWQGASGVSDYDGIVSPAYTVITPKDGNVSKFWGYYFKLPRVIFDFYRYSQGLTSDTWNLKFRQLSEVSLSVPGPEEQQKIADLLAALDDRITAEHTKLTAAKQFKKALLQRMFV